MRAARRDAGVTLQTLSAAVGVSIVYLSDIERGRRNPPRWEIVERIEQALGLPPRWLDALVLLERPRIAALPTEAQDAILAIYREAST
jgi:transcriptional regulator with XRE-family HTH domain